MVLNALTRDAFERDWIGCDVEAPLLAYAEQMRQLTCVIDGVVESFSAPHIINLVRADEDAARDTVEEKADEAGDYLSDDEIAARAREHLEAEWVEQLEGDAEFLAVTECKTHYFTKSVDELVAFSEMLCQRQPALRERVNESLATVLREIGRIG
jgi:hypothetical protein